MGQAFYITSFYKFLDLRGRVEDVQNFLESTAAEKNIKGLIILANEGINSTLSAENDQNLNDFKKNLKDFLGIEEFSFKDSEADNRRPFRRFKVKIRPEIVTLGTPDLVPMDPINHHLSPTEWNRVLKEEKDYILLDTRNWYETKIGTFKNAVDPKINQFSEFPAYVEKNNLAKDKKMLIFCTGGIRCEKATAYAQDQGLDVYQIDGGILKYFEDVGGAHYNGDCFVFDYRVAVNPQLQPVQYETAFPDGREIDDLDGHDSADIS